MTFPALSPSDPLRAFRFAVTLAEASLPAAALAPGGIIPLQIGFSEVSGLGGSIEIHPYQEGGRNHTTLKFPTRADFGNITFKRGVAFVPAVFDWFQSVRRGNFGARRSIMIAHLDEAGVPAQVWSVRRAIPTSYTGPNWDATQSTVAVESLEVVHEGIELVSAGAFALELIGNAGLGG